ncbi:threonine synthase [Malassezia pachydermatis]|uniref:Threonine synthase n=1 Tax=Malassezia pachydermatis TaxID=77020 RepID=A0A0M8MTD2_9BASI|nr:threonine synthase [Malassezia pachydermatis]KOS13380.1 threonine synthase [Malassezia pachydermatis]
MKYLSTRGGAERLTFEEAVLRGLAPNGGLYVPAEMPQLPADWQTAWADLSFVELSFRVVSLFVPTTEEEGGIPSSDLRALIEKSYATFRHEDVTPLHRVSEHEWCLELWHGPTFAFKDVALQLLGNLFEYFLERRNMRDTTTPHTITVVGATSGDTGSAAIAGLRSKANVHIFILHPRGRVSPIQEAQMTTILDENVHNLAVEGTFDDCQDIVKALFSDKAFNDKHHLGAINSINWARILSQIVYYFAAFFALRRKAPEVDPHQVQFVVPTGNFGDILAGYYAKRLGVPMAALAVATNENDILQRFWATGRYEKQAEAGDVRATLSPAMDILVSSNFERLLFYIAKETSTAADKDEDAGRQVSEWMQELKTQGRMVVSDAQLALARRDFVSERVSDAETRDTILRYYRAADNRASYLIDPHTAVAFETANRLANGQAVPQIILSTAHPAKFSEAVVSSIASDSSEKEALAFFQTQVLPKEMHGLLEKERRVVGVAPAEGMDKLAGLIESTKAVIERDGFSH